MVAFVRRRKGSITLAAATITALVIAFIGMRSTAPALATSGLSPYATSLATDANPDPDIFETTISAESHTVDIGNGVMANVLTYNGTVPGPEIRLKVGDTVIVHFQNNIAHPTAIHWHGIELSNANDGTPLTQNMVPPGGTFFYKFKVTRPGIYWYHPHHHSSTNQVFKGLCGLIIVTDPNEILLQGSGVLPPASQTMTLALSDITVCKASGQNSAKAESLCITSPIDEDGASRLPSPPGAGPFLPGDVPNIQLPGISGTVNEGEIVLTNGMNVGGRAGAPDDNPLGALDAGAQTFDVVAGQGLRLQVGSEATVRFFRLRLTGTDTLGNTIQVPLIRVGGEGGLLDHAVVEGGIVAGFDFKYDHGEVLLDPGDRVDVVAVFPTNATGVFTLWTKPFQRQGNGQTPNIPTVPVAHFNVTGTGGSYALSDLTPLLSSLGAAAEVEVLPAATGSLLDPSTFVPTKPGTNNSDVQLTNTGGPGGLGINNVRGEHDFPGDYTAVPRPIDPVTLASSARYAKLGDVLQLTVTNMTGAHHPFHLHGFSIQPISLTDTMAGPPPAPNGNDASPGIGPPYTFPYHEFRDNIDVPAGYTLTFRVRLDDRPQMDGVTLGGGLGRWVFHCHIFFHASFGMISEFDVVDASGNERPYISVPGPQTADYHDPLSFGFSATDPDGDTLTLAATGLPAGLTVTDNGNGTATVGGILTAIPGVYVATLTASDGVNPPVTGLVQITVTKEETTLSYTGPTVILNGANATLSAVLKEDGLVPIAGRTVDFTLGAQACSGVTNGSGVASCIIAVSSTLGGSIPITANFTGDAFYLPVSQRVGTRVRVPARGAFVVGDLSAAGVARSLVGRSVVESERPVRRGGPVFLQGLRRNRQPADEYSTGCVRRTVVDIRREQPAAHDDRPIVHGRPRDEQRRQVR